MINTFKLRFYIELCLFFSIINISLSIPEYKTFDLKILLNKKELDPFYIVGYENDTICKKWFPSLINPILLVDTSVKREDLHSLLPHGITKVQPIVPPSKKARKEAPDRQLSGKKRLKPPESALDQYENPTRAAVRVTRRYPSPAAAGNPDTSPRPRWIYARRSPCGPPGRNPRSRRSRSSSPLR